MAKEPKAKTKKLTQKEQSERFRQKVRELEDAGELNPTDADERFEDAFRRIVPQSQRPSD